MPACSKFYHNFAENFKYFSDLRQMSSQINNPLHGKTLKVILEELLAHYGWEELGRIIPVNCFIYDPGIKSSLNFLRKTPWARKKLEDLYIDFINES